MVRQCQSPRLLGFGSLSFRLWLDWRPHLDLSHGMGDGFPKLTVTLDHDGPMPLTAFTDALTRLSGRYGRYSRAHGDDDGARLYISEIRHGSIIIDLVPAAVAAQVVIDGAGGINSLVEFGKNIASLLNRFRSGEVETSEVSITDCDDVRAVIKPVIQTEGGGLTIAVNGDANIIQPILLQIDQHEAKVIDNRAALLRSSLNTEAEQTLNATLFVWKQIQDAPGIESGKRSPDRGIIASVDKVARPVTFADGNVKEGMYRGDANPFEVGFVVDARVLLGPNGPAGYRITALHDVIPLDPS